MITNDLLDLNWRKLADFVDRRRYAAFAAVL
jgi:hypothetical protein